MFRERSQMGIIDFIPRKYVLAGALLLLASGAAAAFCLALSGRDDPGPSSADGLAEGLGASEVGGEGTPEYNLLVEGENRRRAAEARASGESFAAVPAGGGGSRLLPPAPSPLVKGPSRKDPPRVPGEGARVSPPVRPMPEAARAETRRPDRDPSREARAERPDRALAADLKAVRELTSRTGTPAVAVYGPSPAARPSPAGEDARAAAPVPDGLSPGRILYAVTDLGLNSDVPSPVVATVAEGPLKGAKAIGSFRAEKSGMVIAFTRIVPEGGREIRVEAVGVDPDFLLPSVRSRTDTHFWERWGSLAAASFLEGLGGAASGRRTRVYVSGDAVVEEGLGKTVGDMTLEAAGKVGERAAVQVERGFDRPPTVTVRPGEHVGILILAVG
ncbi:MAG: hypothetical protein LBQ79_03500 [Deltaproteobacteria bacterium]|jgi:type IV secretory pathway VirB10-like protein|nr:hypothetical protein [Deltaproteobacteria bacterium]